MNSPSASMTASVSASASSSAGTSSTSESENASTSPDDVNESGLTAEEQKKVDAGEYVAASVKHRAFNVPKPVFPEAAREETLEGAEAFIRYWVDLRNYASSTGDVDDISRITAPDNDYEQDFYRDLKKGYLEGAWLVDFVMKVDFEDNDFVLGEDGTYRFLIRPSFSDSYNCTGSSRCEPETGDLFKGRPGSVALYYDQNQWTFVALLGVEGIDYNE
ncbi:DUF6318 family protein [Rothia sp. CCM 9418]